MVKTSSSEKTHVKKGSWSPEEDRKLETYIKRYGIWNWSEMSKAAGLARTGKSCRLRWVNYLRPDIKRGNFSKEEEETIMTLHETLGNRWSAIAERLPGRTDNEVKNYWNGHLKKRLNDSSTSTVLACIQEADNEASLKKRPELDQPSLQPEDSISKLEGISAINTTVVSPQPQFTSSAPTNCEIGKDQNNIVDEGFNYTDNTSSETLIEELQSLWSADQQPVLVGNGRFFDPQIRGSSSTCTSQLWPQDPTWPYDFYQEYDDCYDWVDYVDKTFGN